ncbi:hypothetical protein OE88DRAFT_1646095 [Heliocybe sulcata]|uniref:Hydrophobic surface binding protein A n=1 Tax=Heliocybe sulcata TaxID=5364 RepID=A0A5C3MXN9_9AGAM|nr:hypothetical protein OE88DRAFT_1646095 [Heliocybe sulcata]
MQLTRIVSFVLVLAVGAAAIPAAKPVAVEKRDLLSSVEGILTTLEGDLTSDTTQLSKPGSLSMFPEGFSGSLGTANLVTSGEVTTSAVTSIVGTVVSQLEGATTAIAALVPGLKKRQATVTQITTALISVIESVVSLASTISTLVPTATATTLVSQLDTALSGLITAVEADVPGTISGVTAE